MKKHHCALGACRVGAMETGHFIPLVPCMEHAFSEGEFKTQVHLP